MRFSFSELRCRRFASRRVLRTELFRRTRSRSRPRAGAPRSYRTGTHTARGSNLAPTHVCPSNHDPRTPDTVSRVRCSPYNLFTRGNAGCQSLTPRKHACYVLSMPDSKIRARFARLVKLLGGTTAAGKVFHCSTSMVSLIQSGDRRPGLKLAARIERKSKLTEIPTIRATAWT
jgi:hypothetical protein